MTGSEKSRSHHLRNTPVPFQAADPEEIQLTQQGGEGRPAIGVTLPSDPIQPASEGRTPLSSLGGGTWQALTPPDGPALCSATALFYNGLFRNSFRRGLSGLSLKLQNLPLPPAWVQWSMAAQARSSGGEGGFLACSKVRAMRCKGGALSCAF